MEHTPGPWEVQKPDDPDFSRTITIVSKAKIWSFSDFVEVAKVPAYRLATTDKADKEEHDAQYTDKKLQANAHLIAAAPELLAVAKLALGDWIQETGTFDFPVNSWMGQAKAAIDKAEGREDTKPVNSPDDLF